MAGTAKYIGFRRAHPLFRLPTPCPLSPLSRFLSPVTDGYRRFPNQTAVEEEDYSYFIEDINFQAVDGKLLVGAA